MQNHEKSYHCTANGVFVYYTGSKKHSYFEYDRGSVLYHQLYGNSYRGENYQDFEDNRYSYQQNKLYQQCLYGLQSCTADELAKLTLQEKRTLQYNHKKTQQLINLSKWSATSKKVKEIFTQVFKEPDLAYDETRFIKKNKKSNLQWFFDATREILPEDNAVIHMGSLKDIGGKGKLIEMLITKQILPSNFHNLKVA